MRHKQWLIGVLVLTLLTAFAAPTSAQNLVNLSVDDLDLSAFPQSRASVTVRNENGVPIPGLGPQHFEIVEDGQTSFPPAEVTTQVNPEATISVVMVIDISGSMKGKPIKEAVRAANVLLDQLSPQDRAALIAFADKVTSLDPNVLEEGKEVGFTTDKNAVRNVVNFLETKIGWDTPLYDAIYKGVRMASTEPVGRRAVIVMTDGRDERDNAQGVPVKDAGSVSAPDDPIAEANRHNIPIFSVGLVGLGGKIDTKYLTRLATRTGGIYQEAPKPEDLAPLFENVVNQLKEQYILTYRSTLPQDANYHSLLIRVNLPQGQAWDEAKFRILEEEPLAPTPPPASTGEGASAGLGGGEPPAASPTVVAQGGGETAPPAQLPTPAPVTGGGEEGIVDRIKDTIQDNPLLLVIIGVGLLLLFILIIALVAVLLRGRKRSAGKYAPADLEGETFAAPAAPAAAPAPAPQWQSEPTFPSIDEGEGKTEVAPGDWPAAAPPGPAPFAPPPPSPAAAGPIPEAGGTRIIERAPKHLAMLVDKKHPDRKYDLKGTVNVGRAHDNQLVLDDPSVSRHHAWIKPEGEDFLIFDVGSSNGTFVNDERVTEPRRLESGDEVRFGEAQFIFTRVF